MPGGFERSSVGGDCLFFFAFYFLMIFPTRLQKTKQEVAKAPLPSHPLAVLPVRRLKVVRDLAPGQKTHIFMQGISVEQF